VPIENAQIIADFSNPGQDIDAFRKFLCALYNRPYVISTTKELEKIIFAADFYCALPILSSTIFNGLHGSRMFELDPSYDGRSYFAQAAPDLIHAAYKIRNPVFFRMLGSRHRPMAERNVNPSETTYQGESQYMQCCHDCTC